MRWRGGGGVGVGDIKVEAPQHKAQWDMIVKGQFALKLVKAVGGS